MSGPSVNTDRELYREDTGDPAGSYYENSVFVTESGAIGMNVGGTVFVRPIADWHALAAAEIDGEVLCNHDSWAGLMALLDDHWPEDVFPTRQDHPDRDPGPRIVSLIRRLDRASRHIATLQTVVAAMQLNAGSAS